MREDLIDRLSKKVLRKMFDTDVRVTIDEHVVHKEGDVWEENGKMWTIEDGLITSYKKFETSVVPLYCPKCKKYMKHELDEKTYELHKHCYNCQSEFETTLKIEGRFEEYNRLITNGNIDDLLERLEIEKQDFLANIDSKNKIFNSDGVIVETDNSDWLNIDRVLKNFEEKENYLKSFKQT